MLPLTRPVGSDAEAYCTYQPSSVRIGFIVFQCLLPGICGLLAAWGAFSFPLLRSSHAEVVAGIAAHKDGNSNVQDPLTKVRVPVPNFDPTWKAAQAAYDHYSDSELQAAARAQDKAGALALLKGSVTKSLGLEAGTLIFMLVLVLVAAAEDTSEDMSEDMNKNVSEGVEQMGVKRPIAPWLMPWNRVT